MKSYAVLKNTAERLRKEGYSYTYIMAETGVSKGTLSGWLSKIPYQPNKETIMMIGKARAASGSAKSRLKLLSIKQASIEARKDIGKFNRRDLFMIGLGLYIGEGSKSHNVVRIVNSDPRIIKLAIRWFTEAIGVPRKNFSIRIHLYPESNQREVTEFWSRLTGLPIGQFKKIQVDYREGKRVSKQGKTPYGTAHLSVNSCGQKEFGVFLSRRIEACSEEVFNNMRV